MRHLIAAIALAVMGFVAPANAQWVHQTGEDDPFAGGAQHLAITISGMGEVVGFRCTSADDLALLFVSIEKPNAEDLPLMAVVPAKLLVIVDSDPVDAHEAKIDTTPDGDKYRFSATDASIGALVTRVRHAKKRLALAVEIGGKRAHSTAVSVRMSNGALGELAEGCKLE